MEFDWDPTKSERTRLERGFGFEIAAQVFNGPTIESMDGRRDYGEIRVRAIGEAHGFILVVVFTDRQGVRRIISARPANKRERALWHDRR